MAVFYKYQYTNKRKNIHPLFQVSKDISLGFHDTTHINSYLELLLKYFQLSLKYLKIPFKYFKISLEYLGNFGF